MKNYSIFTYVLLILLMKFKHPCKQVISWLIMAIGICDKIFACFDFLLIKKFFIDEFGSSISGLFMGLLMKRRLTSLKERMDPRTLNGGVFVGLNGLVIKSHGSSDSKSFYSALKLARNMCQTNSL